MAAEDRIIPVDDFEHRLMIAGINHFRNDLLQTGKPTEDVETLLRKVLQAPARKKRREDRDAR